MNENISNKKNIHSPHHHHHHHHEDGADKFRRKMKNEKRHWQLAKQITFTTLCLLVAVVFAFLIWSYVYE